MNPAHIQDIITALKEDKSCVQPWRNYALKALNEALAFMRMGQTVTNLTPPAGFVPPADCICPEGALSKACPVHGVLV